jgi:hypothetical protein
MIRMPKRVSTRWREIASDPKYGDDTYIEVLFTSRLDPVAAADLLTASLRRVQHEHEETHTEVDPDLLGVPFAGEWDVTPVTEGALLFGGRKSDDGEAVLHGIVADLDRHGVSGKLDLYVLPEAPGRPAGIGVIDASLRIVGQRVAGPGRTNWSADRDALERVVEAATDWCLGARPDRAVTINSGVLPTMLVRRGDSPYARVRAVLYRDFLTTFSSIGDDRFRIVAVHPDDGRVSLLEGGPGLHRSGWRPTVAAVTEFLASVSAELVYARVRREYDIHRAESPETVGADRLRAYHWDAIPYEDHLAPDAYAVQLLGPGYQGRLPKGDEWNTTELPAGRVLLEHADPARWFDEITLQDAIRGEPVPSRALLARARESTAPMLFPDVPYVPPKCREPTRPRVWLPQSIVTKVQRLPPSPTRMVALVLDDGRVVEDVELSHDGAVVARVGGDADFELEPRRVADAVDRG